MFIVVSSKHSSKNILIFVKIQSRLYHSFIAVVLCFSCFDILSVHFGYYFIFSIDIHDARMEEHLQSRRKKLQFDLLFKLSNLAN